MRNKSIASAFLFALFLFGCEEKPIYDVTIPHNNLSNIIATLGYPSGDTSKQTTVLIPNGDFERWYSGPSPSNWVTNSCPLCDWTLLTYLVQQDTDTFRGRYAAKFVRGAYGSNSLLTSNHPFNLKCFFRANLYQGDSVAIKVLLYNHHVPVDSGKWVGHQTYNQYTRLIVPITNNAINTDSIVVKVYGGVVASPSYLTDTQFILDDVSLMY